MSWHLLERLLDEVSKQSTFVGKVWITLLFVFRIIAITRMADSVYADEQAAFKCNTKQPGCENVCFNDFSPISHVRFWGFQVIIVATPSMIFIVYALHIVSKLPNIFRLSARHIEVAAFKGKKRESSFPSKQNPSSFSKLPCSDAFMSQSKQPTYVNAYEHCTRRQLCGHMAEVISFGNYPRVIGDSDDESPPAYNNHNQQNMFYYEEVPIGTVLPTYDNVRIRASRDDLYTPKSRSWYNSHWSFSPSSEESRMNPKRRLRRHSDGSFTPGDTKNKRGFRKFTGSLSASSCDLTSHDDVTKQRYTVAKECSFSEIYKRSDHTWGDFHMRPKASCATTPKSDKDSAFSESPTSLQCPYIIKSSPRTATTNERRFSNHTQSTRFMTSQSKLLRHKSECGFRNNAIDDVGRPVRSIDACSSRTKRTTAPSRTSSCYRSVRARAVIKRLEDRIAVGYFVQCVIRLLLETAFLVLQYLMFDFKVPEKFQCERWPCPHTVDCFVSRPREKSTLLYFMFGVTVVCIALTWHEIVSLSWRFCRKMQLERKKTNLSGGGVSLMALTRSVTQEKKKMDKDVKYNDNYLLDRYARYIQARNGEVEVDSCSDTKTHSSSSESESASEQESFNSEDLSSMFDNENIDIGDFTEAAAAEGGDDFV
uniref:Gap junction protein n=1 Tax=Phallusia mammillata TaxID=59560 RepID=A0A6F9DI48_9ASCI|nr:uncharacterized protein LOC100181149 [Phallusia mammillata]